MLGIALLTRDAGSALERTCRHLRVTVPETIPLLLFDAGSSDRTATRLAQLATDSHAQSVQLTRLECSIATVTAITRRLSGCRYVLVLHPEDRLVASALTPLDAALQARAPGLVLLAGGWWLSDPRPGPDGPAPLAYPDAARWSAQTEALGLTPDPRLLLSAGEAVAAHDPFADPGPAWGAWEQALQTQGPAVLFPDPVVLRPLPECSAAPAVAALRARLAAAPRGAARGACLARLAPWLGDALSLSPAAEAGGVVTELHALWSEMPRGLRRAARALPGPAGEIFRALSAQALQGTLGLLATAHHERVLRHLLTEQRNQREDLDLALPGPDYLAELYARVRGL